jgi:LEA14-like dessication related protein
MEITPKLRNGLIIGGLLVATVGVIAYVKRQINLLMDSCYTISGGVLHNLSLNNVKITLFFKIKNESDLTINISDLSLNLYVNNMFVT